MSIEFDDLDEFIIQNFRSWSGRNYFQINCLNFLFGRIAVGNLQ